MALYLQSRSSDMFQTDIHPAAQFGGGIFLDHATCLVAGATAVVEPRRNYRRPIWSGHAALAARLRTSGEYLGDVCLIMMT